MLVLLSPYPSICRYVLIERACPFQGGPISFTGIRQILEIQHPLFPNWSQMWVVAHLGIVQPPLSEESRLPHQKTRPQLG